MRDGDGQDNLQAPLRLRKRSLGSTLKFVFLSDVKAMSSLDVLQVPWGPFVRESVARQGKSALLLLQTERLQLGLFHTSGFLGKFLCLKEKQRKKVLLLKKSLNLTHLTKRGDLIYY